MSDRLDTCVEYKQGFADSNVTLKVYEKEVRTLVRISRDKENHELHRYDFWILT